VCLIPSNLGLLHAGSEFGQVYESDERFGTLMPSDFLLPVKEYF
jgi:hypothetical protein